MDGYIEIPHHLSRMFSGSILSKRKRERSWFVISKKKTKKTLVIVLENEDRGPVTKIKLLFLQSVK